MSGWIRLLAEAIADKIIAEAKMTELERPKASLESIEDKDDTPPAKPELL